MDTQNAEEAFVFYRSFFEAMEGLADGDKLALFDAIARMGLYGEQIALPLEARRLFVLILPQLKANRKKREEGRKGGRYAKTTGSPEKETTGSPEKQTTGSETEEPNEKEKEKEKETEKEKEKEKESVCTSAAGAASRARTAPTLEEIEAYCQERGNRVNAQRFHAFYTANGWRIGKVPMRDWKAAVRGWEINGLDEGRPAPSRSASYVDEFRAAMEMARMEEAKPV